MAEEKKRKVKDFDGLTVIKNAWSLYKKYYGPLFLIILLNAALAFARISQPRGQFAPIPFLMMLLVGVVGIFFQAMMFSYINAGEKGKGTDIKTLLRPVLQILPLLILGNILFFLGMVAGLILLVVPGIIFALTFWTYYQYILFEEKPVLKAFKASKDLTEGRRLTVFGTAVLYGLINIVVYIPFVLTLSSPNLVSFASFLYSLFWSFFSVTFAYSLFVTLQKTKTSK